MRSAMPETLSLVTQSAGQPMSVTIRKMLRGKIHRATVTQADLHYEGSISIDATLMRAMDLYEYEAVHVWNVSNGERFETYALEGPADSGVIQVNGAAARKASPGDLIIIGAFTWLDEEAARKHVPKAIMVDGRNRIKHEPVAQLA